MRENQGIDVVDTLLGGAGSMFGRLLLWLGISLVCLILGLLALGLHEAVATAIYYGDPSALLPSFDFGDLFSLPLVWLWMLFSCFMHWIGLIYIPFFVGGSLLFLLRDEWDEPLFFLHLIISPWAALSLGGDGFPWGALIIWLPWSVTWAGIWWMRSRSGLEAAVHLQEVRDIRNAGGFVGTPLMVPNPAEAEIQVEPPKLVSVSIPVPAEIGDEAEPQDRPASP